MMTRLQLNPSVSFKGENLSPALKARLEKQTAMPDNQQQGASGKFHNAKKGVLNVFKSVNNVIGVTSGVTRGIVEGGVLAGVIGVVGKNIKLSEGKIGQTLKGIGKDAWKVISTTISALPKVITEAPIDNLKKLILAGWNGTKTVFRGIPKHKITSAIALGVGLIALAFRTIQGKFHANEKNANLDHKVNLGHV